jgi:hypothetical protein
VPESVVPADAAVRTTASPVSSVAVSVLPDWTASLVVAVMLIVAPALYEPFAVDDEKLDTVASPQLVIVTVRDAPESVPGANEQLAAVPEFEKSPAATPVTDSENVSVYVKLDAFVGVDAAETKLETVGAVTSRVIVVLDVAAAAGPVLPAASLAPPTANSGTTVPAEQLVIVTVRDVPESVPGANAQPVAVPVFEKSPAATPVTDSENVRV